MTVTPFLDLVLAMNPGISFGWFQSETPAAQILLMVIKAAAVIALAIWMARSRTWLATVSLGLIIGGGTAQIQKNIIAERGLGMPREPKLAVA